MDYKEELKLVLQLSGTGRYLTSELSNIWMNPKWDATEREDDEPETEELQKTFIRRLRERIPKLDAECQVVRISMNAAEEELMESGKMNDDLYTLICTVRDLLLRDVKMKATFFYLWISGQISWLKDLVREELKELLLELEKGSHIHEIENTIHFHEEELCRKFTRFEEVQKKFCGWSEKDLPVIGHHISSRRIKFELGKCIDRRLHSLLKRVEKRKKHLVKSRTNLEKKTSSVFL
ncbi:hypothetical protein pdam_00025119 [Pocillopora damicornis]|uniref:Uncharacterized protein n=1 Tax=Pocillopora damicornis TaxID=46731 RepID=A0A3M6UNU3_POCDA|nr:hypothetical protein pdam_00025119 [Pocillopora damicornis]